MSITAICRLCHQEQNLGACGKCYTAFYCQGKLCQKLDWEAHKKFCVGGKNQVLENARRQKCLDVINNQENPNMLFGFLMHRTFLNSPAFLNINENSNPQLLSMCSKELLAKRGILPHPKTYNELSDQSNYTFETKMGISVLYRVEKEYRVYVFGSQEMQALQDKVSNLPFPLLAAIYTEHFPDLLSVRAKDDNSLIVYAMAGTALGDNGIKPFDEGGFFDDYGFVKDGSTLKKFLNETPPS